MPSAKDGLLIQSLMNKEGLKGGLIRRRSSWVAYLKDADQIAEFLGLIGASQAVLDYEDIRARKSLKSSVQRLVNMDRANVSRAVEASIRQISDIRKIDEAIGLPPASGSEGSSQTQTGAPGPQHGGTRADPAGIEIGGQPQFRRIAEIAANLCEAPETEGRRAAAPPNKRPATFIRL